MCLLFSNKVLLYFCDAKIVKYVLENSQTIVKIPSMEVVIPVYFVPGMAADISIFEFIDLPKDKYQMHMIPWKIPKPKEPIAAYAKRMTEVIKDDVPCVLIGVSFGGVVVQEMSKFLNVKKVIVISSVKSNQELPSRMVIARKTKAYKLLPTAVVSKIDNWEKLAFGDFAKKRAALYQKYLSVNDKTYLDWAIENILYWDQSIPLPGTVHIHGDKDIVFPITNIQNCIVVKGGTHVMIINRAKWFNKHLPEIIENS